MSDIKVLSIRFHQEPAIQIIRSSEQEIGFINIYRYIYIYIYIYNQVRHERIKEMSDIRESVFE